MRRCCLVLVGSLSFGVGCTNDRPLGSTGQPAAQGAGSAPFPSADTTTALAPSQITASTVEAPESPPPCVPGRLATWTAQVIVAEASADAVVRIRNDGELRCEVSVSESPLIDPMMEPDVWLDPGEWADLVVGQSGDDCLAPEIIKVVTINVDGRAVAVPTAMVSTCGWWLTALYPNEVASGPCDPSQLGVTTTGTLLAVRNDSFEACSLGELVAVTGRNSARIAGVSRPASSAITELVITDLAPGDVIGFPTFDDSIVDCSDALTSHNVTFSIAGTVKTPLPSCLLVQIGPGRPFYGDPAGPLSDVDPSSFDPGAVLVELDPFASIGS